MKKISKILALIMGFLSTCSIFVSCAETGSSEPLLVPDYSESTKEFNIWSYHATCNGWYQYRDENGILRRHDRSETDPVPISNAETIQEYKDCGFNILFISYSHQFDGRDFENSDAKKLMDIAYEKGLKCFVHEQVTSVLSRSDTSLIQPGSADGVTTFESQQALNTYIADVIKDVIKHPAFYGFSLRDEPSYKQIDAIAEVYKAIQASAPGCFVNMNLFPMPSKGSNVFYPGGAQMTAEAAYTKYLEKMATATGAPYIRYDDYPIDGTTENPYIDGMHLSGLKLTAEFCKEKGLTFGKAFQSCELTTKAQTIMLRKPTKRDMYWQMNLGMAFGVKDYSYWTYYPVINTSGEFYDETSTFLTRYGEKNDMWYWMSEMHPQMQATAKALMNFEYQGVQLYNNGKLPGSSIYAENFSSTDTFKRLKNCTVNGDGSLLITELYDQGAGFYGYFIVNASDPVCDTTLSGTIDFGSFGYAQTYTNGEVENKTIKKGKYSYSLDTGEGVFVIPYK